MRRWSAAGLALGLGVLIAVLAWQGLAIVAAGLAEAGWQLLWLPVYFLFPLALAAASWQALFPPGVGPGPGLAVRGTWVALAVNWLLPVAQVGGELARGRVAVQRGLPLPETAASLVADKTLQVVSQLAYTLLGVALFAGQYTGQTLVAAALGGSALLAALTFGFYRVQRRGLFGLLSRMVHRLLGEASRERVEQAASQSDSALHAVYGRRGRLAAALAWRVGCRLAMAGEVYLALQFLGEPVSLADAIILESLGQAVRSAAFAIPGGLGAQEAGFALLGLALGIGPDTGLALSLAKRVRELALGLPGLAAWQLAEARRAVPGGAPG